MYYWYKMAVFYGTPEDKYEAEMISVDYIIFQIRPNVAWKKANGRSNSCSRAAWPKIRYEQ
jgi:hypothetical protein